MTDIEKITSRIEAVDDSYSQARIPARRAVLLNVKTITAILNKARKNEAIDTANLSVLIWSNLKNYWAEQEQRVPDILPNKLALEMAPWLIADVMKSILDEEKIVTKQEEKEPTESSKKEYKTALGRNIDKYRIDCGWSFDALAGASGIDKNAILAHVNKGIRPRPVTLRIYADTFSKQLKRTISIADLTTP